MRGQCLHRHARLGPHVQTCGNEDSSATALAHALLVGPGNRPQADGQKPAADTAELPAIMSMKA